MFKWHPQLVLRRLLLIVPLLAMCFALTATAGALPLAPPSPLPPQNVTALPLSVGEVQLAWLATRHQNVRGYAIFRNDTPLVTVNAGIQSYHDFSVIASTVYIYTIATINLEDRLSPLSSPAIVKTPALPETPDLTPPSPPQSLTATAQERVVLLDWYSANDDSDITAYQIRRDGLVLALVNSGTLSYFDRTIQAATTYTYTVEALDSVGHQSMPSNLATVTTAVFTASNLPPAAPALLNIIVDADDDDELVLAWSAVADADLSGYTIWRNGTALADVISTTLTYQDTDVVPSIFYTYTVEALDTAGNRSEPSAAASAMLPTKPPYFLPLP
jgi:large repetitive protein